MKKLNAKSLVLGFIIGIVGISTIFAANEIKSANFSNTTVTLGGVSVPLENPLVSIVKDDEKDMQLYMPVRELLEYIGYSVNWDEAKNNIDLIKETPKTQADNTNMIYNNNQNQFSDVEPVRTVDITESIDDRNVKHVIEIDIPRLDPQQHIVLDDMFELQNGDIVTYDMLFGDIRSGAMVAFVPDRNCKPDDRVYWGTVFDTIYMVEPERMYYEMPIGFSLNEAYLILRNQHATDSNVTIENIRGTVTISRTK